MCLQSIWVRRSTHEGRTSDIFNWTAYVDWNSIPFTTRKDKFRHFKSGAVIQLLQRMEKRLVCTCCVQATVSLRRAESRRVNPNITTANTDTTDGQLFRDNTSSKPDSWDPARTTATTETGIIYINANMAVSKAFTHTTPFGVDP